MTLPLPTRIDIGASGFLNAYWWALIAGTVGGGFAIKKYYGTSSGQLVIDQHDRRW